MAANVLTTGMFALQVALLCFLSTSGISAHIKYAVSSSNQDLPSNPALELRFDSHPYIRQRRQAGSGGVEEGVDATNSGTNGQISPNQSSQPVSPASTVSGRSSSTPVAASSTTLAPKVSATTPNAGTTLDDVSTQKDDLLDEPDIIHDFYNYYSSDVISNKFSDHWIELENAPRHETLSTGHRVAAVVSLMFDFYFYGHKVNNVTIATGGFIYMSPFLHQWLTATQYIAPLMANFDPSFTKNSSIFVQSEKNRIIVEWKNIVLRDQNASGMFHFQAILNADSTIKFIYKAIPFPVANISSDEHPVKVGLSDAYYNDTYIPETNIKRRTIYEYHKVVLPTSAIKTGMVIILTPLPTCNRLTDCDSCVKHTETKFDCRWCNTLGRCSDGLDWYRQHWDKEGCQNSHTTDVRICPSHPTPPKPITDPLYSSFIQDPCSEGKCNKKSDFSTAVIVVVVLIIVGVLAGLAGWGYYAYTHPTSRSGLWLMEHRPSQIKSKIKFWKSSSDADTKYKVESET
jgi:hypothetical protein